jgi:hypothetical protein
LLVAVALAGGGCASTQLNYNTLDLGSTVDQLLNEQVIHNLSNFIDNPAAIPAQIVINSGTATTANTLSASYFDPLTKALTLATTIPPSGAQTVAKTSVDASKSLTLGGNNVATQNWAFEPIHDADQLRRLYTLYRFAVLGNDNVIAQRQLIQDYPLHYITPTDSGGNAKGPSKPSLDPSALIGPNCVLCMKNSGNDGPTCRDRTFFPNQPPMPLCINKRLLPLRDPLGYSLGPWLRWSDPADGGPPNPRAARKGDIPIGRTLTRTLYVDGRQPDRYGEFVLFVSVAAESGASPSSSGGAAGKQGKAAAQPAGILIGPNF